MSMESDPTAVMGRRIGAVFIDGAIVYAPAVVALVTSFDTAEDVAHAAQFCDTYEEQHDNGFCVHQGGTVVYSDGGTADFGLIVIGMAILMFVIVQGLTGWTVGKLATGIRVVGEDGRKAGFGQVLVRWLFWIVDGFPYLLGPLVGLITSLTTVGHRRVGDMVAKTHVVRKDAVGTPPMHPMDLGAPSLAHPSPTAKAGPQWDEARGTYIQWDPEARDWMQWDEPAKTWHPIITAPPPAMAAPPQAPPPPPPPPPSDGPPPPPPA
jgi:uncharacterized RDD family membrane protein YckC